MFVIKHLRTTRKEKSNKTGRVVSHWSARVATVVSQTGDEIDGTRMGEIPARDIEGRAQALWATPTELQTFTPPKQRKRRGLSFPSHKEGIRTRVQPSGTLQSATPAIATILLPPGRSTSTLE